LATRAEEIPLSQLSKAPGGAVSHEYAKGLELARRMLAAQKKDMRQIIMITDGKAERR
jgi:Ca-activated chloride channel family protein